MNWELVRGDNFSRQFRRLDRATGVPIDLAGKTAIAQLFDDEGNLAVAYTYTQLGPSTDGTFLLSLTDVQSLALTKGIYFFDIRFGPAPDKKTPIRGCLKMLDARSVWP